MRIYAVIVLVRSMPRNLWAPLLRQRESRWLTIELGLGVVVMVVMGPTALGAPVNFWVLLGALGVRSSFPGSHRGSTRIHERRRTLLERATGIEPA